MSMKLLFDLCVPLIPIREQSPADTLQRRVSKPPGRGGELRKTSSRGLRLRKPLAPNDLFCCHKVRDALINGSTVEGFVMIMEVKIGRKKNSLLSNPGIGVIAASSG